MSAHDSILAARVKQTRQANRLRRPAPFQEGDLVYLSTQNLRLPKGRARKLVPKYIGPYKILRDFGNGTYAIDIPSYLKRKGVHENFHASLLRIHIPNDDRLFPGRDLAQVVELPDLPTEEEWAVDSIIAHSGQGRSALFKVRWKAGDTTWLPYDKISHLAPLQSYLELVGVSDVNHLPNSVDSPPEDDPQISINAVSIASSAPLSVSDAENFTSPDSDTYKFVDSDSALQDDPLILMPRKNVSRSSYPFIPTTGPWITYNASNVEVTFASAELDQFFHYHNHRLDPGSRVSEPPRYKEFVATVRIEQERYKRQQEDESLNLPDPVGDSPPTSPLHHHDTPTHPPPQPAYQYNDNLVPPSYGLTSHGSYYPTGYPPVMAPIHVPNANDVILRQAIRREFKIDQRFQQRFAHSDQGQTNFESRDLPVLTRKQKKRARANSMLPPPLPPFSREHTASSPAPTESSVSSRLAQSLSLSSQEAFRSPDDPMDADGDHLSSAPSSPKRQKTSA